MNFIRFGALAPTISQQFKGVLPIPRLKLYDKDALALIKLSIRGVLTEKELHLARKRLVRMLEQEVRKYDKSRRGKT